MHRQLIERFDDGHVKRRRLWHGKLAGLQGLLTIRRIVREHLGLEPHSVLDERLYALASEILKRAKVPAHDKLAAIRAVHYFVLNNVRYVPDPAGGHESIEHPWFTLQRGYGDCDALVTLEADLLGMVGISEVQAEAARYSPYADGYQHVYLRVPVPVIVSPSGWLYLDPSDPEGRFDWHRPDIKEAARILLLAEDAGLELAGFGGFLKGLVGAAGVIAAPFTGGTSLALIGAAGAIGSSAIAAKEAGNAARNVRTQFDTMAHDAVALFDRIQGSAEVTPEDLAQAESAYSQLSSAASQYGTQIKEIAAQWNSQHYKPAFESRLAVIRQKAAETERKRQAAAAATVAASAVSSPLGLLTGGADGTAATGGLLLGLGAGAVALFLVLLIR
jgi:hypothetical protein